MPFPSGHVQYLYRFDSLVMTERIRQQRGDTATLGKPPVLTREIRAPGRGDDATAAGEKFVIGHVADASDGAG